MYSANYNERYALIIGINSYKKASPLEYACNDAQEIKDILIDNFKYKEENIVLLLDIQATKDNIMNRYMEFIRKTDYNDNVIIFYAGHGYTEMSSTGDVGYLIPYDADTENLYTLIRWDDFTRNTDLIKAKHVLFIMDACYSGLAITRSSMVGKNRFLKDMLMRPVRQVLTAGKANETVSDGNGPVPNHSIFTGHLIEALKGRAKTEEGLISANIVMSYVYRKVSNDTYSQQTPHYGYLNGDGDFIFNMVDFSELFQKDTKENEDVLVKVPAILQENITERNTREIIGYIKELITDNKNKIKIYDIVTEETRKVVDILSSFSHNTDVKEDTLREYIEENEKTIEVLQSLLIIICYWGGEEYINIVKKSINILSSTIKAKIENTMLLDLRWYSVYLIYFSIIFSCIESENYKMLENIINLSINDNGYYDKTGNVLSKSSYNVYKYNKKFSIFTDKDNYYFPLQEYLYKRIQPKLDDLLCVGEEYDKIFQIVEIIVGMNYAIQNYSEGDNSIWAIPGTYAYKYKRNKRAFEQIERSDLFTKSGVFNESKTDKNVMIERFKKFINDLDLF